MSHRRLANPMQDRWEALEIGEAESIEELNLEPAVTAGLSASPNDLHVEHLGAAIHLAEVQEIHARVLVSAGDMPEQHISNIAPMRKLAWVVDELHGQLHESGLTIPLRGTTLGKVELTKGELQGHPALKLAIIDTEIERVIPLPDEAGDVTATWVKGDLHLIW